MYGVVVAVWQDTNLTLMDFANVKTLFIVVGRSVKHVAHPDSAKSVVMDVTGHCVKIGVARTVSGATSWTDAPNANLEHSEILVQKTAEKNALNALDMTIALNA